MIMHRPNSPRFDEVVSPRASARRALTVIELLLTLSTLSIFTGVLASGLTREREDDRTARCLKNLRFIMQTALTYAENDPDNILGPVHPNDSYFYLGAGYVEYGGGPGTMAGSGDYNYLGWDHQFDPRTRPFNQLLYGFEPGEAISPLSAPGDPAYFKEFQCPGWDQGWQSWQYLDTSPLETESSYFKGNGTSFRMNNLPYNDGTTCGVFGRSSQQIPAPGQTIDFMEARVFETIWTNDTWSILEPGELTGYHQRLGFFNVVYCDGHASVADFGDGTYNQQIDWGIQSELNGLDVRGTWGRMDCLPGFLLGNQLFSRSQRDFEPEGATLRRIEP